MSFKSFSLPMFEMVDWARSAVAIVRHLVEPYHIVGLLAFVGSLVFLRLFEMGKFKLYFIFAILILFFYEITSFTLDGSRYFIGFELILVIFPLLYADRILAREPTPRGYWVITQRMTTAMRRAWPRRTLAAVLTVVSVVVVVNAFAHNFFWSVRNLALIWSPTNLQTLVASAYGVGGQLVDRVVPADWTISTTELNTFGFMNDREILDLYGYTNPEIAHSKLCSGRRIRNDAGLFLRSLPDLHWYRTISEDSGLKPNIMFENAENMMKAAIMNKYYDFLGNASDVMMRYNTFILIHERWYNVLLVRKDRSREFSRRLITHEYSLARSRPFDHEVAAMRYGSQAPVKYRC